MSKGHNCIMRPIAQFSPIPALSADTAGAETATASAAASRTILLLRIAYLLVVFNLLPAQKIRLIYGIRNGDGLQTDPPNPWLRGGAGRGNFKGPNHCRMPPPALLYVYREA